MEIFWGIDLQAWDIYVPFGFSNFSPNINIHKNILIVSYKNIISQYTVLYIIRNNIFL